MSDRIEIVVRPEGDGPPASVRLRRALKHMLRVCGLRAVSVRPAAPTELAPVDPTTFAPTSAPVPPTEKPEDITGGWSATFESNR